MNPDTKLLASLGLVGAVIGIGKVLASGQKVTLGVAVGRAILNSALGLAAAAAVLLVPAISFPAQVGLASLLASLGTSALERAFQKYLTK